MEFTLPQDVQVILASKSPRRRELLAEMGITYVCLTEEVEETFPKEMHPRAAVVYLSRKKAEAVKEKAPENAIIIASDTMVEVDGIPLGKPVDEADASRMLWMLSGRHHNVHTGLCVMWGDKVLVGVDSTDVFFRSIDQQDIDAYIENQTAYYDPTIHEKIDNTRYGNFKTWPTYIRNAIDHPDSMRTYSETEFAKSIELLRLLCKNYTATP